MLRSAGSKWASAEQSVAEHDSLMAGSHTVQA
jgi:hypothetical protein